MTSSSEKPSASPVRKSAKASSAKKSAKAKAKQAASGTTTMGATLEYNDASDQRLSKHNGHRLTDRLKSVVAHAGETYKEMVLDDIENKVTDVSPQIGVLWFSSDSPDFQEAFDCKSLIVSSPLMQLPVSDRTVFVVERPPYFLRHHRCGSVAAEMESLRYTLSEKLDALVDVRESSASPTTNGEVLNKEDDPLKAQQEKCGNSAASKSKGFAAAVNTTMDLSERIKIRLSSKAPSYFMWPLHDEHFNRQLLGKLLFSDSGHHVNVENWFQIPLELLKRLGRFMGLVSAKRADLLEATQAHFGTDVAIDFLFTYHYILFSWILAAFALCFHIMKNHVEHDTYRTYIGPFFQFAVLFPWSVLFTVAWRAQVKSVASTWMSDILDNDSKYNNDNLPDFMPWDPDNDPDFYPNWMRALRTLPVVPLICVDIFFMSLVLAFVFWAEMYIIFEWGQCGRINAENGNHECRGADVVHGFLGGLYEALPGLLEGLLFELLLAFSRALARFAVWLQNWRTQTQKDLAYMFQLIIFEFIGKFGWIGCLALIFVPDWYPVGMAKQDKTHRYDQTGCYPPASENLDSRIFESFDAMENSISCLKSRTQYETRLLLFEGAVAAPFWVSQLVSLLIKTLVPTLVVKCRACFVNDHGPQGGCRCKCGRVLLRLLSCMCLLDVGNLEQSDCDYLVNGDIAGQELFDRLKGEEAEISNSDKHLLKTAWKEGIREAYQPLDENIETGMHWFWVILFAPFYPKGVLLGVIIYVLDVRSDFYRLTIVQQRNFRKPPEASLVMLFNFMRWGVACSSIFNSATVFATYQGMSRWSDNPKYDAYEGLYNYWWELVGMISGVAILLQIIQVIILHFTHSYDAEHLETTSGKRLSDGGEIPIPVRKLQGAVAALGLMAHASNARKESVSLLSPIQVDPVPVGRVDKE